MIFHRFGRKFTCRLLKQKRHFCDVNAKSDSRSCAAVHMLIGSQPVHFQNEDFISKLK